MLFFSTTDSGSILNRFSQDLQLIDMELPIAAINTFASRSLFIPTRGLQLTFLSNSICSLLMPNDIYGHRL